jgi:amylosucrase
MVAGTTPAHQPVDAVLALVAATARQRLGEHEGEVFLARARRSLPDAWEAIDVLFGRDPALLARLVGQVLDAAVSRPEPLRLLDHRREIEPDWFLSPAMVGYVCYPERFAGSLAGIEQHLDYLAELGVTYLHLMPLLRTRPGENDGGYAVADYRAVEPSLGTIDDLEHLAATLRDRGISLCVDVVINHTAYEHEWAVRARAGDPGYRGYYRVFPDRTMPDAYEATLREVFPDFAPGSFTWDPDLDGWVWTTFNRYQWDLNHENPAVFAEMLDVMLFLANRGVEVLRLDAVPFTWKRLGTDGENQPEAHRLLQAWRALVRIAAPAVVFKAEAIVPPDQLVPYLGGHERFRPECDLAYHNQLMVMLWNSLATRDARLATHALGRMAALPAGTSWCTYIRCHDDIGWAVSDEDAAAVSWYGVLHRRYLADFFAGRFPGSFARGVDFQANPLTGDARTSGTAAALCGIEAALADGDGEALELGVRRLVIVHSVIASFGGIPLLYMGDELALRNDAGYLDDPARANDNRWMHRPPMDWEVAARRADPSTLEAEVYGWLRRLVTTRASLGTLHAAAPTEVWWSGNDRVLAYRRHHPRSGPFLALVNVGETEATVARSLVDHAGVGADDCVLASAGRPVVVGNEVLLPPLSFAWFAARATFDPQPERGTHDRQLRAAHRRPDP